MYRRGPRITRHNWNDTRRIHVGLAQCGGPLLCRHPARLRLSVEGRQCERRGAFRRRWMSSCFVRARALPLTMTTLMLCPSPQFLRGAERDLRPSQSQRMRDLGCSGPRQLPPVHARLSGLGLIVGGVITSGRVISCLCRPGRRRHLRCQVRPSRTVPKPPSHGNRNECAIG